MSKTYSDAVAAIRTFAEAHQAHLDREAITCRAILLDDLQQRAIHGVDRESPAWEVAVLLAQTIGLSDGYPKITIPQSTRDVIIAAANAAILQRDPHEHLSYRFIQVGAFRLYIDASGIDCVEALASYQHATGAFRNSNEYRRAQTWATL
jgi:hypothetical protein